jgi:hypothetical protein
VIVPAKSIKKPSAAKCGHFYKNVDRTVLKTNNVPKSKITLLVLTKREGIKLRVVRQKKKSEIISKISHGYVCAVF